VRKRDDDFDQLRVVYHEASHAATAFVLGRPVWAVSVRETRRWGGVYVTCNPRFHTDDVADVPRILAPARLRRPLEVGIVIALAGRRGEALIPWPDEERAARLASLPRYANDDDRFERAMLTDGNSDAEPPAGEDVQAAEDSLVLVGPGQVMAHVGWLRAVACSVVGRPRTVRMIDALAARCSSTETSAAGR
jgi:hypothetical protein